MPLPVITPHSIKRIERIGDKPIYKVYMNDGDQPTLVVKGEYKGYNDDDGGRSAVWSSKLMAKVSDPVVKVKVLTREELNIVAGAVIKIDAQQNVYFKEGNLNWVKMSFIPSVTTADVYVDNNAYNNTNNNNKSNIEAERLAEVIYYLEQDICWYSLGKVTAADIFNGNNDRLTFEWNDPGNFGSLQVFLGNAGNIMFGRIDGFMQLIGLDAFHASQFNSGISNLTSETATLWPILGVLSDDFPLEQKLQFSAKCVVAVGTELFRAAKKSGVEQVFIGTLDGGYALECAKLKNRFEPKRHAFCRGLEDGIDALKEYLTSKYKRNSETVVNNTNTFANAQQDSGYNTNVPTLTRNKQQLGGHHQSQVGTAKRNPDDATNNNNNLKSVPWQQGKAKEDPAKAINSKNIPPGVLTRMKYLGWI